VRDQLQRLLEFSPVVIYSLKIEQGRYRLSYFSEKHQADGRLRAVGSKDNAAPLPNCSKGNYVLLEVGDSGSGIPEEIRERIFEPFFTTKEVGRGTGLGLSTVAAILKSHGGGIAVDSEPNTGSVFRAYLPAISKVCEEGDARALAGFPRGNGEVILVVDDEELILNSARRALTIYGYKVLTASDGAKGMELYTQNIGTVAAVVTDMMMPRMDGAELIEAIRRLDPAVPIIAASGYGSEAALAKAVAAGVRHHIQKPYTIEKLLDMLHQLIHSTDAKVIQPVA